MTNSSSAPTLSLSANAVTVLERRYLKRDAEGKVLESPDDMFRRVAHTIASAETLLKTGYGLAVVERKADGAVVVVRSRRAPGGEIFEIRAMVKDDRMEAHLFGLEDDYGTMTLQREDGSHR